MKRIILLIVTMAALMLPFAGSVWATSDHATFYKSISLWQDEVSTSWKGNIAGEEISFRTTEYQYQNPYNAEEEEASHNSRVFWAWVAFGLSGFILFLVGKWAYLAIMLTDYEKFIWDMRDHYYKHYRSGNGAWPEGYHFPYDETSASSFILNFKVWTLPQALHPFTYMDYNQWDKDNNWRPSIS